MYDTTQLMFLFHLTILRYFHRTLSPNPASVLSVTHDDVDRGLESDQSAETMRMLFHVHDASNGEIWWAGRSPATNRRKPGLRLSHAPSTSHVHSTAFRRSFIVVTKSHTAHSTIPFDIGCVHFFTAATSRSLRNCGGGPSCVSPPNLVEVHIRWQSSVSGPNTRSQNKPPYDCDNLFNHRRNACSPAHLPSSGDISCRHTHN